MSRRVLLSVIGIVLCASVAEAQTERTLWGAAVSLAPSWRVPSGNGPLAKLAGLVLDAGDQGVDVRGADFRIGMVRGRLLSGEWGVSFVRRTVKDGSTQGAIEETCETGSGGQTPRLCFTYGTLYVYQGVTMRGVELNKLIPFVMIKNRVQIGIDVAGGVGAMKGTAERREADTTFVDVRNAQGQIIGQRSVTTINSTIVDARELLAFDPALIGRVELAVAGILPQGLRVRVSTGINFPGSHTASLTVSYFFGRE